MAKVKVKEMEKEVKKSTKKVVKVKNAVEIINDIHSTNGIGLHDDEDVVETTIVTEEIPKGLEKKVDLFLKQITNAKISSHAIDSIAEEEIKGVVKLSKVLNKPISNISKDEGEANKIGTTIIDLKNKIEVINPSKVDLEPNFIQRFLEKITGKTGLAKYFEKFETYSGLINEIIEKLEVGGQTLKEDNILFMQDRDELKVFTKKIKEKIDILNYSSMKLQEIIAKEKDEDQRDYLKKEVEYQLQQQIIDLQQILLTSAQGVMALDILIRNNNELITSVKRIKNVTIVALNIGVMVSFGLANQKKVLEVGKNITNATNDIISTNAELLRTQGLEIHKQASNSILDMDKLQKAFKDTIETINEAEEFRVKALPEMREAVQKAQLVINEFDKKVRIMDKQSSLYLEN